MDLGLCSFLLFVLFSCIEVALLQGTGSGTDGNLRLCIVEGRGTYKRGNKYCPILDDQHSGIECVIGVDRLDCLRRIHKGTVDFGAFNPEDLVAAQWYNVEVLVTNVLRLKQRPFARSIVAVANNRIFQDFEEVGLSSLLRNTTLCHPSSDVDDLRPLSATFVKYLESLVTANQCDPQLSLTENRIKATAEFFAAACMAGPWVPDQARDAELKRRYPSLCGACASRSCSKSDLYWGDSGALNCLGEFAGDVTWAELDDVTAYFRGNPSAGQFSYLCKDGSKQPLTTKTPCVWLHQPWNVIVSKRKAAQAVSALTASLSDGAALVSSDWRGALAMLLEVRGALPAPLSPARSPQDFLATAAGFVEAYSQHGCNPPRYITLCSTSLVEYNKCVWVGEAGAVYGVVPALQCARRADASSCASAVAAGEADALVADGDWLVKARRDYSLTAILHEASPIIDKMTTISAFVRSDSGITKLSELRGKRAAFPRFDGVAWHSVLRYLTQNQKENCKHIANDFFSSICAPGVENYNVTEKVKEKYTETCYKEDDKVLSGEEQALRSLVEGKSDVAFISRMTYNLYREQHYQETWAKDLIELVPVCPEENKKYCFVTWSNIGHIFVSTNLTEMKKQEVINLFTNLDMLFGNHAHQLMFSMYGTFNHQLDVLFHNNTRLLVTDEMYQMRPYNEVPLSFERSLANATDICQFADFTTGFAAKFAPRVVLVLSLVFCAILVNY